MECLMDTLSPVANTSSTANVPPPNPSLPPPPPPFPIPSGIVHPRYSFLGILPEIRNLIYPHWISDSPVLDLQPPEPEFQPGTIVHNTGRSLRFPGLLFTCKQIYNELFPLYDAKARTTRPANDSVCHVLSFRRNFEDLSHVIAPPLPKDIKAAGLSHIWLCLDDNAGLQDSYVPDDDLTTEYESYASSMRLLQRFLSAHTNLQRFEIEWRVVVERPDVREMSVRRGELAQCGCCEPVDLKELMGEEAGEKYWAGMRRGGWIHRPDAERIHRYGFIAGWKAEDGEWIVKYFRKPGVFSWLTGKMEGVPDVWARQGKSIVFDGLRISDRPTT